MPPATPPGKILAKQLSQTLARARGSCALRLLVRCSSLQYFWLAGPPIGWNRYWRRIQESRRMEAAAAAATDVIMNAIIKQPTTVRFPPNSRFLLDRTLVSDHGSFQVLYPSSTLCSFILVFQCLILPPLLCLVSRAWMLILCLFSLFSVGGAASCFRTPACSCLPGPPPATSLSLSGASLSLSGEGARS